MQSGLHFTDFADVGRLCMVPGGTARGCCSGKAYMHNRNTRAFWNFLQLAVHSSMSRCRAAGWLKHIKTFEHVLKSCPEPVRSSVWDAESSFKTRLLVSGRSMWLLYNVYVSFVWFCMILFVFCDLKIRFLFIGFCARQSLLVRATDLVQTMPLSCSDQNMPSHGISQPSFPSQVSASKCKEQDFTHKCYTIYTVHCYTMLHCYTMFILSDLYSTRWRCQHNFCDGQGLRNIQYIYIYISIS